MTKWGAEAGSFKVTSNADFIAPGASLQGVVASDTAGNPAGYVRLFNTNPGVDDPAHPSWRFTDGGTRTWTKRRRIALTVPPEPGGARASRTNEKVNVEIGIIGGANANWSDLRLTDAFGAPVPFRLQGYETPVDNPNTPVKILFEATANPLPPAGTPVNYWLYYGNPEALSVATSSINPFYLKNHDFENGFDHWGLGFVTGPTTAYFYGIEDNNSYLPEGFPGYENKSCFLVCHPEGQAVNIGWLGASQTVDLPGTGTYVLNVYGKTLTSGSDASGGITSRIFLLDQDGNNWEEFRIPAGISEWNLMTVTRRTNRLRLTAIMALNHNSVKTAGVWRERRINYDWVELVPKYPFSVYLDDEIDAGYQRVATYTSQPFDTGEVSPTFEAITWSANTSGKGTSIEFFTRTGATQAACTTAPWSSAITVNGGAVPLPHARWIQFMARLKTSDTGFTPLLEEVEIFYSLPTKGLTVQAPPAIKAGSFFEFTVTALDGTLATATRSTTAFALTSPSSTASFPVPAYAFQMADQGSRVFQGRQTTAGPFTIYASATVGGIASGAATITCLPDETVQLWFEGLPTTITAGQPVNGFVRARDRYGNLNTADTATLFFTCTDPYPASFSATRQLIGGQIALTNMAFYTVSTQTLTVIDNLRGLTATHTFTVLSATPAALGLNASPVQYQGVPFPLTVDVLDAFGNVVPTHNGPFTLGVSSGTVTPNSGTFASGTATIYPVLTQLGNLTLTATDPTPLQGQLSVGCYQLPPPSFDGYGVDAGFVQLAGVPFILTITARDFGGNTLTSYKGACRIIPSVGEAIPSVSSGYSFLDGVLALSVTLTGASDTVNLRVEDIGDPTKFGSVILNVKPGGVERFEFVTPPAATAGASLTFEVRAVDSGGNLVSNYTGTIMLTHDATGGDPSLPTVYTFTLADKGRRVFSGSQAARFTKAETVRLKVEDSGRFGLSAPIVIAADSTKPRLTISPAVLTIPVGRPFTFDVALLDPFLNPLRNFTGTIGLGYSNLATGPSWYTFAPFEDGYHRFFLAASATTLGPFRIFATETTTLATATSEIITAVSDRTTNFLVRRTDFPGSTLATAGEKVYFQVTASDSSGNLNVDYLGNVRFSSGDPAAQLPPDSNLTNGLGGFEATFFTAGTHTLYVRDVADPSILGSHTFSVRPAPPSRFRFTFPTSRTRVGIFLPAWSYSLQVVDAYGNLASITGSVSVSCTDTGGRAPQLFTLTNQSVINDTWWFASAGVQLLIATSTLLPTAYSEPILASAGPPASITFQGPRTVSNEFYFPFLVKIVDAFGNPTALATNTITPGGSCQQSWDANPTNYTLSPEENGTKLFNIRWQMDNTTPSGFYPGSFAYPGLPTNNFQVFVDNPRHSSGGSQTLSLLKLSAPDRPVIASEPFRIVLTGNTVRDNAASFSGLIDFSITDGQIFVSSGTVPTAWNEYRSTLSIPLPGTTQLTLWAYATRSGYQTMVARLRNEPLKQGSVSFVVQSNPIIRRATLTADSPQKAKIPFPFKLEWWDLFDNYAENAVGRFIMNASTTGAFTIAPAHLLVGGRGGKFDTASNTEWFETKFQIASSMTEVYSDLVLGQLRLRGIYDEDFTDNSLDNGLWNPTIVNCGAPGQANGKIAWENQLRISTIGPGSLYVNQDAASENQDDACSFLYFDWPASDTAPFTAQLYVKRTMYDVVQRLNNWSVGLMIREGNPDVLRPKYIALQMRNGHDAIHNALRGFCTYRTAVGGTSYRLRIPNQAFNLHPKWLELSFDGVNTYQARWSNDLVNYRAFTPVVFSGGTQAAYTETFAAATLDPRWSVVGNNGTIDDIGAQARITPGAGNLCIPVFDREANGANCTGQNLEGSFRVGATAAWIDQFTNPPLDPRWSIWNGFGTMTRPNTWGEITPGSDQRAYAIFDWGGPSGANCIGSNLSAQFRVTTTPAYTDAFTNPPLDPRWGAWSGVGAITRPDTWGEITTNGSGLARIIYDQRGAGMNVTGITFESDFRTPNDPFTDDFQAAGLLASWSMPIGNSFVDSGNYATLTTGNGTGFGRILFDYAPSGIDVTFTTIQAAFTRNANNNNDNYRVWAVLVDTNGRIATGTPRPSATTFYNTNNNTWQNVSWTADTDFTAETGFDFASVRTVGYHVQTQGTALRAVRIDNAQFPAVDPQHRVRVFLVDIAGRIATGPALPSETSWFTTSTFTPRNTVLNAANCPGEAGFDLTRVRYLGWQVETKKPNRSVLIDNADFPAYTPNYRVAGFLVDVDGRVATGPILPTPTTWYNNTTFTNRTAALTAANFPGEPGFRLNAVRHFGWFVETENPGEVQIDNAAFPAINVNYRVAPYLIDTMGRVATGPYLPSTTTWYNNTAMTSRSVTINSTNFPGEPSFNINAVRYFGWLVETENPNWVEMDDVIFPSYPLPGGFIPGSTRLGIFCAANSNLYEGGGWITELRIDRYPPIGTFTSVVYDAGSITTSIGPMTLTTTTPGSTRVRVYARASNDPGSLPGWTYFGQTSTVNLASLVGNRYFQYALELIGDGPVAGIYNRTPIVKDVRIPYSVSGTGATFNRREVVTMIASSSPAPAVVATVPIEIRGGTVADLRITAPASTTAGQAFTITVAALDEAGNVADDATGTLVFGSNDGDPFPAQVPKPYTLIPSVDKGQHVFYNAVILKNAISNGLASITVTDSIVASWAGVVVNPGPIDSFIASAATPQVASVFFPVFFEARDAFANRKTDYSASATFYDNKTGGSSYYAPSTLGPASWVQGVATLTPGAAFTKAHTVNVSIQSSNRTGTTNPIEIIGGPAYSLQVLTTTNQPESGSPFDLTVTALDYFGNVAPAYTGTVQITSTDQHPAQELPPPYTFQLSDKGTKTFTNLKLITPGVVTLTAADMAVPTLRKDYPVTVLPGKVARFDVSCTSPQTAGVPFNTLITAYDAFGYLKTNYSGSVTLGGSFSTIIPDAAISGFSNGQLLVPSTVLNHGTIPHSGWLVASQGTAIGTRSVQLLPPSGVFDHFFIETIPATPTAGDAFKMVVKAVGPNGAVFTAYAPTSVVLLTASNAAGLPVVPALTPSSITNFEIGVKEVYAHLWEAGTITLWAYDPVLDKVGSRTITVLPSTLAYFTVTPATSTVEPHPNHSYQVVGGSFPLTIKAYDNIDNFKDTYSGTVTLTHNGGGTLSVTQAQIVNGSTTVLLNYDAPGIINIFARDTVFDKTGASKHIRFFGPLACFLVEADTDQTHDSPFMAQLTALDTWGQIKLNTLTGVGVTPVSWLGPPPAPAVTPTLFDPLTWNLGKALTELNVDCHNDNGTFTIRFTSTSVPTASGEIQLRMHTQATVVTQICFEFFSPQKAGEPFFFRVRGCDANNAVVPGWHRDVEITANPFQEVHPSFVAESAFSEGTWATTTARMYVPGDYFILASSTNMAGIPITGSRFIRIEPGPLAGFRFRFPPSWNSTGKTKLFLPFTMAVEAITGDGSVKTDYEPAGNLLLKLNATATGFLGVTSIPPENFVNGVATISDQTYNKSQVILMRTSDPETGLTSTSGPLTVHGDAAKFAIEILPPGKGSAGDPILWRNFFQVRLTAQDVNNFPVSDYTGTVAFSTVPGALPTPATSSIFAPYHLQVFPLNANAQATFTLKVDYDEGYTYPVHLRLKASDTISGPVRITPDLVFDKLETFDHWEFVSPLVGQKLTKGKYFPMYVRSVSNYGNDWPTFATPVLSYRVLSPASGLTNFTAEPPHWTFLPFGGAGNYATSAMILYDEKASSSILLRLDEGTTQEASVTVEVHPVYGPTVGSGTVFQEIATTTFPAAPQSPGRFILSTYVCPGSGAATLGLGYHADDGSQTDFQGVTIDANGSLFTYGSIAEAGVTDRFSFPDPDNPGQMLTWYRIYVAVDAVFNPDAASRTYLILKNASPDTASHSVWFDGVQVEKALFHDQTVPTTFGSSRKVVSPNTGIDLMGRSRYYQW